MTWLGDVAVRMVDVVEHGLGWWIFKTAMGVRRASLLMDEG